MSEAPVLVELEGPLATVTLNRPARRNAATVEMCAQVHAAVQAIAASSARVLILRGAGEDFCVGADFGSDGQEPAAQSDAASARRQDLGDLHQASAVLHTMPQVTLAVIDGGCAGAGLGWAAACDLRWASTRARFSTAFLNVGLSGDMGTAWSLTRLLGPARAREWLYFADKQDAQDALAAGFVTRLFAPEALHDAARALALDLCARDPLALALMKANCLSAEHLPIDDFIRVETERHLRTTAQPDLAARMRQGYQRSRRS